MTASGLTQIKASSVRMALLITMAPFNYRCPNTALRIQALAAAEEIAEDAIGMSVTCVMCQLVPPCERVDGQGSWRGPQVDGTRAEAREKWAPPPLRGWGFQRAPPF